MSIPCWVVWRVGALLVACMCASSVCAQAPSAASVTSAASDTYRTTIDEALGHFGAHRWHDALLAFRRAHAIDPSARTLRGIGLAAFYFEDYATARTAIEDALASSVKPLDPAQRTELTRLLSQAQQRASVVTVQVEPSSARVEVSVEPLAPVAVVTPTPPVTTAPVDLSPRHAAQVAISAPVHDGRPTHQAIVATEHEPSGHTWTWIAAATVPVFVATALLSWKLGSDAHTQIEDDCRTNGCDQATIDRRSDASHLSTYETITTVSWIGAGSAVALGVVALLLEGESP